ncbi:hypothetical protein HDIA_0283 [Hartmannibacter diazotrophicus]|uniref:Copper chaperone PCu(A)C n=1 Tax=Hartmannibacter diazotrophicus TaxID=1482074 RepID=A0A2C9D0R5_9HYPH|nr:copper chaperone PCu(A)C [Hartmannibacter diazotrophicus]SON53824.1 hypothetical protein HDIA_0283 [Hartmannibacter diazotrophicus]
MARLGVMGCAALALLAMAVPALAEDAKPEMEVIGDIGGVPIKAAVQTFGPIRVVGPFSRSTNPGAHVAGVYMKLENTSDKEIRLLNAATDAARDVLLHDMPMIEGVVTMTPVSEGIPIPAHGRIDLHPGGYHIMLSGLVKPLQPGRNFPMTLAFSDGTKADLSVNVWDIQQLQITTQ